MLPIFAGTLTPDHSSSRVRRVLAGLGLLAALLALGVQTDPFALVLLGSAAVLLTGAALHAPDRRALIRFVAINGAAILLLGVGAFERSDLVIQRTPEQLEVSLNGVRLAVSLAGVDSPLNQVSVGLSAVDERPMAAPWTFERLPWLEGFGDWLAGGMRGGLDRLRVVDATNGSDVVPAVVGLWQPDHPGGLPRLSGSLDAWSVARAPDLSALVVSPEIFTGRYQVIASAARPSGQVSVTLGGDPTKTALEVVAAPDRRLFGIVAHPPDGSRELLVGGPFVYRRSVVGWLQAIFRDLGRGWLVALALVAAARLLAVPMRLSLPPVPGVAGWMLTGLVGFLLGFAVLVLTRLVAVYLLDEIPHTVESIAYLFEAQIIELGGLWAPAPVLPEFFQEAYVAATPDGRWFGVLPIGQSLLLAAGLRFGAPWLVGPIASGLSVGLTVVLGRATYGTLVGVVAGLLLLFSPFLLTLSGDMLAHPAGLLLTVVMMLGVMLAMRSPATWGWLVAGLAMGGLVLTRPLAAVGIGIPLTISLVLSGRSMTSGMLLARTLVFVLAAAPTIFFAGFVNASLTGNPFVPPLSLWSDLDRIGFGPNVGTRGGHDLAGALGNSWANLAVLLRHLYGWPTYLTLALACVPFVLGTGNVWDRLLGVSAVGLGVAHWLYWSDGIIYGPRFEFEAVAAFALLTARGAVLLARADGWVPPDPVPDSLLVAEPEPPTRAVEPCRGPKVGVPTGVTGARVGLSGAPLVVTLVAALFAINLVGYLPDLVLAYRDYNGVSPAGRRVVEEAGLERAIVFVASDWPDWQSYGSVFLANGPFLDGNVVYVRDLGEAEDFRLTTRYPESRWWQLRGTQLTEMRR